MKLQPVFSFLRTNKVIRAVFGWSTLALLILFWCQWGGYADFIHTARQAFDFEFTMDYGEGPLLDQAVRLANGQNIYRADVSTPPYTIANYPPLFVLVQVPFVKIFGPALWYGRLISVLGALAAMIFLTLTVHALTGDWIAGAAAGTTLFMLPAVNAWAILSRIDMLALAFMSAGLYATAAHGNTRKGRIWGALLLLAAVFTRQSYGLAAPLAAFLYLLRDTPRRKAFEFALLFGGAGLALFVLLTALTGGGFFFNIVTANVNPFKWETVKNTAGDLWRTAPYLLTGAGFLLLSGIRVRIRAWWMAAPLLVGALASAATIGKDGSNINYILELCFGLALAAGILIAWAGHEHRWFKVALLLVLALQTRSMVLYNREHPVGWDRSRLIQKAQLFQLDQVLKRAEPGAILADEHMASVVLNGRALVYQPFEFKMLAEGGVWDAEPFLESIRQRQYTLILLYTPPTWDSKHARWTEEMLQTIYQNYQRGPVLADTEIYRPRR